MRVRAARCILTYHAVLGRRHCAAHIVLRAVLRENGLFWSFPYVCPEPVLVKRCTLIYKWLKKPVSLTVTFCACVVACLIDLHKNAHCLSDFPPACPEPVLVNGRVSSEKRNQKRGRFPHRNASATPSATFWAASSLAFAARARASRRAEARRAAASSWALDPAYCSLLCSWSDAAPPRSAGLRDAGLRV